jgi:hypothetical protein
MKLLIHLQGLLTGCVSVNVVVAQTDPSHA